MSSLILPWRHYWQATLIARLHNLFCRVIGAPCLVCGEPNNPKNICDSCFHALSRVKSPCHFCGNPSIAQICGVCRLHAPPYRLTAPFQYHQFTTQFVHQLKFQGSLKHAKLCGEILATALLTQTRDIPLPEVLIPVPLSQQRLQERGFNQSLEIAKVLHHRLGLPIDYHVATRLRHTKAQAQTTHRQRKKNMQHAFSLATNDYRHIAIIDDVVTTGATVSSLARLCQNTGIKNVEVWAVAKSIIAN